MKPSYRLSALTLIVIFLIGVSSSSAEEYIIGTNDVIEIRFWQEGLLNDQVKVNHNGEITIDIVGQVKAAGKTASQLQSEIVKQITRIHQRVSQAVVRVIEFNHNYIFIIGEVTQPGKRSYEEIPSLWNLITEAGGVSGTADLSRVTIIRGGDKDGEVEVVNVRAAVSQGKISQLPKIGRTDTIEIPRMIAAIAGGNLASNADRKNLFYVIGAVASPGPLTFEDGVDIMDALALAGGPAPDADMKKARLMRKDGIYSQTITINLKKYSEKGTPARYILQREDTFYLPRKEPGFLGVGLPVVAGVVGLISSFVILLDRR